MTKTRVETLCNYVGDRLLAEEVADIDVVRLDGEFHFEFVLLDHSVVRVNESDFEILCNLNKVSQGIQGRVMVKRMRKVLELGAQKLEEEVAVGVIMACLAVADRETREKILQAIGYKEKNNVI